MAFQQELASWFSPEPKQINEAPAIGTKAPSTEQLPVPSADGRPMVVTFLRHCGCPFAEKTYRNLRATASRHPSIRFVAVSHSDQESTDHWLASLDLEAKNSSNNIELLVDARRDLFAAWGLGAPSSLWHVLSPASMYSVYCLGRDEGIWNRPTESGNRWQQAGSWAVGADGAVRWGGRAARADDVPDFEGAVEKLVVMGGGEA